LRRLSSWLPPLVYMAVIFYVSSLSNPLPQVTARVWDKLLHTIDYAGLGVLFVRALRRDGWRWRGALVAAILMTSLYGASDEFHQWFVPGRSSAVSDWVADTVGAVLGAAAYGQAADRFARRFRSSVPTV
jgi:VanZ family protein